VGKACRLMAKSALEAPAQDEEDGFTNRGSLRWMRMKKAIDKSEEHAGSDGWAVDASVFDEIEDAILEVVSLLGDAVVRGRLQDRKIWRGSNCFCLGMGSHRSVSALPFR
jgi:hypothetical protein